MYRPTATDSAPIWQAYVEDGLDKEERNRRLAEAPEVLRTRIRKHVVTAFSHTRKQRTPSHGR